MIDKDKINHDLAISYAESKLSELLLDKRDAPLCGSVSLSAEEVKYLKSAYDYAVNQLSV